MTNWRIRRASAKDATGLSDMMRRAIVVTNAADYPPDVIDRLVARHGVEDVAAMIATRDVFSALDGDVLVGTIALEGDQLRGLFVEPDRQGEGLGGCLVASLEAHAVGLGHDSLWLQSSVTANAFYTRRGWVAERFVARDDGSVTIMRKRLR